MVGTILDIETTGFLQFDTLTGRSILSDNSEILEVGFITIDMNTIKILSYGTLYFYKPYFNIESDAQRIHGITREFLKQYENQFNKNLIALNSLIQNTCIIGKNSKRFDMPFIKAFIEKHAPDSFDIEDLTIKLNMDAYNGGKVHYVNPTYGIDLQDIYKERFRERHYDKYTYYQNEIKKNNFTVPQELIDKFESTYHEQFDYDKIMTMPMITPKKKGSLGDYIDCIPNGQSMADSYYNSLDKERVTGKHGALYDAVLTFIVWLDARIAGLC